MKIIIVIIYGIPSYILNKMNVFERNKENQVKKELCLYCWFGSSSWSFDSFDNIVRFECCFGLIQSNIFSHKNLTEKATYIPELLQKMTKNKEKNLMKIWWQEKHLP